MDFGKLLHVAKKNSSEENEVFTSLHSPLANSWLYYNLSNIIVFQGRCYSTKFSPPKKETKDKSLSSGIKRFLAKRDEEEREKERQLRENRERLEAMRTNKSKNKINKMLKVRLENDSPFVLKEIPSLRPGYQVGQQIGAQSGRGLRLGQCTTSWSAAGRGRLWLRLSGVECDLQETHGEIQGHG